MQHYDAIFIAPPFQHGNETMWKQFDYFFPPYGLIHIASYIQQYNYKSLVIDCLVECPDLKDFDSYFKNNYVGKIESKTFGITAVTPIIDHAIYISHLVKQYYPNAKVILGGPHPTHMHEELILEKDIDIVVRGEGEITFREILDDLPWAEINGITYKTIEHNNIHINITDERKRIRDLDSLPIPAYDLVDIEAYKAPKYSNQNIPSMSVVTSRGCIGNCAFCSKIFNKLFFMSPERVMKEIKLLYDKYDIRQIIFYDDNFTGNKKRVQEICQQIIEQNIEIQWTCFARADCVDYETLSIMKKAGCEHIMYGVENFNQDILQRINKHLKPQQIFDAFEATRKAGIPSRASMMIGNPGETKAIIRENIKMLKKLKPNYLQVLIFHPLPGAPLYNELKQQNRIIANKWDEYNFTKPIFLHENLSQKEIRKYYILMYVKFYLSFWFILSQVKNLFIKEERRRVFWGLKAFFSFIIKNLMLINKDKSAR